MCVIYASRKYKLSYFDQIRIRRIGMKNNPKIYEINTRVWIKQFAEENKPVKLVDVPDSYWEEMENKGFEWIWLMGVWQTCDTLIDDCCFEDYMIQSYDRALDNWTREDIIGSPFAIDKYEVLPELGSERDIFELRNKLHKYGLKLILDFVPNHFGASSQYIESHPDIFLEAPQEYYENDPYSFFKSHESELVFAHARDPFFPPWRDTVQINCFSHSAAFFIAETLNRIAEICDGVRCDKAQLLLNNVFNNTWSGIIDQSKYHKPGREFWASVIEQVKTVNPDFLMIGEAYWNLEWQLLQQGFDYAYDKKFYDRLKDGSAKNISDHLHADWKYLSSTLRFLEHHEEDRVNHAFGFEKTTAAAVILSTIPGMKLFYDGQLEGKKIKMPVQLGRMPVEKESPTITRFYRKLLSVTSDDVFKYGDFKMLEVKPSAENNDKYRNILAYQWTKNSDRRVVIVNYSNATSQSRVFFPTERDSGNLLLYDALHNLSYERSVEEINKNGLFVELTPWMSHILHFELS